MRSWPVRVALLLGVVAVCLSGAALGVALTRGSGNPSAPRLSAAAAVTASTAKSSAPREVVVPMVVGLVETAAVSELKGAGFVSVVNRSRSQVAPPGTVFRD